MTDWLIDGVEGLMGSPWVYVALLALAALDGFFPIVPSETLAITAGVYAAAGDTNLVGVIVAAAAGAVAGDHIAYALGRLARDRTRERKAFEWARQRLAERGGSIIIVCRYIPGARTATTLTAGAVGHPLRSFTPYDVIAGVSWGAYTALIGYLGGSTFEDQPLLGVGVGLGLALTLAGIIEMVRHLRSRAAVTAPS